MSAPTPTVSPELKVLMRKLRLGQLLDTLPERLALAKSHNLAHIEFLEQLFSDEVTRRDGDSAGRRAKAARLDPHMVLEAWDDDGQGHLRPSRVVGARLHALRRAGPQRFYLGAGRRGQDIHGHCSRPHRLSSSHHRALRTGRQTAQATEGDSSRRQLRCRDAQAHRCGPPDHR